MNIPAMVARSLMKEMQGPSFKRTFLTSTQDLSYIGKLCPPTAENVFTILGSGDSVFRLAYNGASHIIAAEANDAQIKTWWFRRASLRALSLMDFQLFLLSGPSDRQFLNPKTFKCISKQFGPNIDIARYWQAYLQQYRSAGAKCYGEFFRGGLELDGLKKIFKSEESLPFFADSRAYEKLQRTVADARIEVHHAEAIHFVITDKSTRNCSYIDLSNIMIYVHQSASTQERFDAIIDKLKEFWDSNKTPKTMVLDYMFGVTEKQLRNEFVEPEDHDTKRAQGIHGQVFSSLDEATKTLYGQIFSSLKRAFGEGGVRVMEVDALTDPMPTKGTKDCVIYVKKE